MYQNDIFYRKANENALTSKQSDVTKKKMIITLYPPVVCL